MEITLFNTLSKRKEIFKPITAHHVSMYHCGPTVYNFVHIGNLRAFIAADILRRVFEFNEYEVKQVMNITDIGHLQSDEDEGEDKMTLALKREGKELNLKSMRAVADHFYDAFRSDTARVSILPAQVYPFASDHILEDIEFIQKLIEKGHAYKGTDGIYFDTTSLADYGKLGGISPIDESEDAENINNMKSRIGDKAIFHSGKKNVRDFAVWKFNNELGYDASFGKGFPGWHIECSAMSRQYLGDVFDIHTGGIDHIPVHHNNEIAQSEAYTGKLMAHYWLHNAHIIMEGGKKMAKSGEQFITLDSLESQGISAHGFRFWLLGASYRSPIQFSIEALKQAEHAYQALLKRIAQVIKEVPEHVIEDSVQIEAHYEVFINEFKTAINDDLDTAGGLVILQKILKNPEVSSYLKKKLISKFDEVLGLELLETAQKINTDLELMQVDIPLEVHMLAKKRIEARSNKDWARADELRNEIKEAGYEVIDNEDSYELIKA